jgi:hypothetical protein
MRMTSALRMAASCSFGLCRPAIHVRKSTAPLRMGQSGGIARCSNCPIFNASAPICELSRLFAQELLSILKYGLLQLGRLHEKWDMMSQRGRDLKKALGILVALLIAASSTMSTAQPIDCPSQFKTLGIKAGHLILVTPSAGPRVVRKAGQSWTSASINPELNTDLYYVAQAASPNTEMAFALVRTFIVRGPTSLSQQTIGISNSLTRREHPMASSAYLRFHGEHSSDPSRFRVAFHVLLGSSNSYDLLKSPRVYLPQKIYVGGFGNMEVSGYKARMQRYRGVGPEGRCIRFNLFQDGGFANAILAFSAALIAVNSNSDSPTDLMQVDFTREQP